MNGFDVCRQLRRRGIDTPVIMLTAKTEEVDRVVGLEIGADDYVIKPFSIRELEARIRVQLRHSAQQRNSLLTHYRFGEVEIDFQNRTATRGRKPVDLTERNWRPFVS